jgi:hypothetical protein
MNIRKYRNLDALNGNVRFLIIVTNRQAGLHLTTSTGAPSLQL